jgi:hypothetical protein
LGERLRGAALARRESVTGYLRFVIALSGSAGNRCNPYTSDRPRIAASTIDAADSVFAPAMILGAPLNPEGSQKRSGRLGLWPLLYGSRSFVDEFNVDQPLNTRFLRLGHDRLVYVAVGVGVSSDHIGGICPLRQRLRRGDQRQPGDRADTLLLRRPGGSAALSGCLL